MAAARRGQWQTRGEVGGDGGGAERAAAMAAARRRWRWRGEGGGNGGAARAAAMAALSFGSAASSIGSMPVSKLMALV
jgi:hypothetical protein